MDNNFDLTGRIAKCSYCNTKAESNRGLWFFEYLGEGSEHAERKCAACGFFDVTHMEMNPSTGRRGHNYESHAFFPAGAAEFDRFYCACRGTD
jgi:hypothetical protein